MTRKLIYTILPLTLLVAIAGAAYLFAWRGMSVPHGGAAQFEQLVKAGEAPVRSPQNLNVIFHESRVAAQPKDADAYRLLAQALVERAKVTGDPADFDRAWTELDRAEPLEPGSLRTITARTDVALARHRFPLARALAEQGLKRFTDDAELLGLAGDAAVEMGDFAGAEAHSTLR